MTARKTTPKIENKEKVRNSRFLKEKKAKTVFFSIFSRFQSFSRLSITDLEWTPDEHASPRRKGSVLILGVRFSISDPPPQLSQHQAGKRLFPWRATVWLGRGNAEGDRFTALRPAKCCHRQG